MTKALDLVGRQFGRLTVVSRLPNDKRGGSKWAVRCECGQERIATGAYLTAKRVVSCGCYRDQLRKSGDMRRGK